MQKIIIHIVCIIGLIISMVSCVDDDSTLYQREYAKIEIFRNKNHFNVIIGDTLRIKVDSIMETLPGGEPIKIEAADPRFEYEWWTGYSRNGQALIDKINDGYELKYPISGKSLNSIVFLVRDPEGLEYYTTYRLTVNAANGTGFIVVDTRDESSSQFHEIQDQYLYHTNSDTSKILRNVYSLNQGNDFQGLVSHVSYMREISDNHSAAHRILATTEDGNMFFLKGDNYGELKANDELFRVPKESYRLLAQCKGYNCVTIITEDGKVNESGSLSEKGRFTFSSPILTGDLSPYKTNVVRPRFSEGVNMYIYDELANRFLKMPAVNPFVPSFAKGSFVPVDAATPLFNYNNVGAFDALFMASAYEAKAVPWYEPGQPGVLTLMKSEKADNYCAYIFKDDMQRIVDLNNCTDLNRAVSYATTTAEKVLYYAVDDKLHAVSLGGSLSPASHVAYTAESGDKITDIAMWKGSGSVQITDINNPQGEPLSVTSAKRMLLITSYNESTKEGKLTCVPIAIWNNPENGLEKNKEYHRVFGGFGRIVATSHMYRLRE